MEMNEYQLLALKTAAQRTKHNELFHLVLGLAGETGEIAEKFKKWVRDQDSNEKLFDSEDLKKELGDVMWYVAVLADYFNLKLEDVADTNIKKLASRNERNKLHGSGDNR